MDLTEMRRRKLLMGSHSMSLGGLTKYQKFEVQTTNASYLTINHNFGIIPKFVLIQPKNGETAAANKFNYYVIGDIIGVGRIINPATSAFSYYPSRRSENLGANGLYILSESQVVIRQYNSNTNWDTNIVYDVEIWG